MSDNDTFEPDPGTDPRTIVDGLVFDDDAATPALPPTGAEIERGMVTTSLKLPKDLRDRLREAAAEHCITPSMLIRQYIEMGLLSEQPGRMIPLSDAIRVLSSLRPSA
ncbi:CopG family transcriptional regulator [Nocardia spumae]|uniref:ribbon-helix-helix domain-containing protein n=1 Tax=Nocardia spumae TaxID=2887190 RepID=UPI001D1490FC|nr:CopG family transcriptional regulator [Nocardia spumae]